VTAALLACIPAGFRLIGSDKHVRISVSMVEHFALHPRQQSTVTRFAGSGS
jgi:hypothetical protein